MSANAPDILLVEDSPTTAELFCLALRINGSSATIRVANDGMQAIELLLGDSAAAPPRLVLLDLHMPGMDGFEVLIRLRSDARTRSLPILMYSASDRDSDKEIALEHGADGFIEKPSGFGEACATIARIEHEWLASHPFVNS